MHWPRILLSLIWWSLTLPLVVTWSRIRLGPARPTWSWRYQLLATWLQRLEGMARHVPMPTNRLLIDVAGALSPLGFLEDRGVATGCPVPARWFGKADGPVLLYLHGGAYVLGSVSAYRDCLAQLARRTQMRVLAVDYRLAPEHPYPAQLEDSLAAYRWLVDQVPAQQIVIAGDSAGGNLCTRLMIELRSLGEPVPAGAALVSPWVDLREQPVEAGDDYVPADMHETWSVWYAGGLDPALPELSVALADLSGLPPLLVMVGGAERLRSAGRLLAERARDAGTAVTFYEAPDHVHAWPLFATLLPECRGDLDRIGAFARRRTEASAVEPEGRDPGLELLAQLE